MDPVKLFLGFFKSYYNGKVHHLILSCSYTGKTGGLDMAYANNQGVRIYYEIEGKGQPLVLQYGQYFPLQVWHEYN
jgi:hypothetical protein